MDAQPVLKKYNGSKKIVLLAIFIALGAVLKITMAVIPNVEVLTFWIFIVTVVYGVKLGFVTGVAANMVADTYIGFGPWTPFISLGFGLVAIITYLYAKGGFNSKRDYMYCGILVTIAFDLFTVITATWLVLGVPLPVALYMQYGFMPPTFYPFGLIHTASNALIFSLLGIRLVKILQMNAHVYC